MTEHELENLSTLPIPPPSADGKRVAIAAALDAFDRAPEMNSTQSPKANEHAPRPTETTRTRRSFRMTLTSSQGLALAASLAALMIAAPLSLRYGGFPSSTDHAPPPPPLERIAADKSSVETKIATVSPADALTKKEDPARRADTEIVGGVHPAPSIPSEPAKNLEIPMRAGSPVAAAQVQTGKTSRAANNTVIGNDFSTSGSPQGVPSMPEVREKLKSEFGIAGYDARRRSAEYSIMPAPQSDTVVVPTYEGEYRDKFESKDINPVKQVARDPVSTFSIDVDTASYAFVRRALNSGALPPKDAVRVEEMINYFPYAYPAPDSLETPFKPTLTVFPSPWNAHNKLVHVAIKGYDLKQTERPRANLVFLIDVSGSMAPEDRLPLIKNALRLLIDQLKPDDTIAILTYASQSGIALEPTKIADKHKILGALDALNSGGSTAGAAGISDAYRLAEANFDKSAVNRVILATDGDFNVGITDQDDLKGFIERKRQTGIFLSILGVGRGNHNDALMQALAQNGNGTASYVDTLNEARKVLVEDASSTLFTIAKDVKIQVEWNPARVSEYRLIGYETRNLEREDFNNDGVDAGDIGSGHTVTAIYEITPVGAPKLVDDLRYANSAKEEARAAKPQSGKPTGEQSGEPSGVRDEELGFLKMRYKRPGEDTSRLLELPIASPAGSTIDVASNDVRFSTAVAAFGQMLKGEPYTQAYSFDDVLALAQNARGDDAYGYRAEFLNLVRLAKSARP